MNYRHLYHAGNFADVFKHIILVELLLKLREKEKPFCIIDTHAGIGLYRLDSIEAQKTLEYQQGIECFWHCQKTEQDFASYRKVVQSVNGSPQKELKNYPGSPLFAKFYLRKQDRLWVSELHPEDSKTLKKLFKQDERVHVLAQDGYQTLKAILPPQERRGLVFIDPPFERKDEFDQILKGLTQAFKRFSHGIYGVWYPIKEKKAVDQFYYKLEDLQISEGLRIEIIRSEGSLEEGLIGCGLLILNPPWQLDQKLKMILPKLLSFLNFKGSLRIDPLIDEDRGNRL